MNSLCRRVGLLMMMLGLGCLSSCAPPQERVHVEHLTLPSRDVQATLPFTGKQVHDAAERTLRDELSYRVTHSRFQEAAGNGRIDAENAAGDSVRVVTKDAHVYQTAVVQVFAVPAGSAVGDTAQADDILTRIEDTVWSTGVK